MGKKNIFLGNGVTILNNGRIEVVKQYGQQKFNSRLEIGDGTSFEQCCHIIAADNLVIGKNCVFSAFVYVSDCNHTYKIGENALHTPLTIKNTKVGDNCFVGIGVKILPGCIIGNNCVIGANSVVTKSFPDYCVIAGVPAKCIKRYDEKTETWKKTNEYGDFIDSNNEIIG